MALAALSGDEQGIIFSQMRNVLDPGIVVAFGSANSELRELTQALLQTLKVEYEVAAALCPKLGARSCEKLREAIGLTGRGLTAADLATLATLGSVLPALVVLDLSEPAAGPDGMQRLAEGLGAGALPNLVQLAISQNHEGDAGASALAAALGRGALPRLMNLDLCMAAIGDAGLVALAPALRRLPALQKLYLSRNPLGDEGLAALVAPPPTAGSPKGGLTMLKELLLNCTQVSDAGCATLAAALDSGTLPMLKQIELLRIPASDAAIAAVWDAIPRYPGAPVGDSAGAGPVA